MFLREKFREHLYSRRNKDISSGTTTVGPHRDDLRFKVGESTSVIWFAGTAKNGSTVVKIIGDSIDRAGNREKNQSYFLMMYYQN